MEEKEKRITVGLPYGLKQDLEKISVETGISQVRLITLATHALVANYNENGMGIFKGLLNISKDYNEKERGENIGD
ncbi:hypothetical protein CON36_33770 [Bacillus cereus]|uniref:Uncharacterized protein n=2 Tax=Bacillus cereus group TaxID=86661 RepID=A0A9X6XV48_BACCE|nr:MULTISPECIES: hypothetical protein [Bacillus cereus group]PDZ94442.1 hypothetical protein CON36_33770 [Bacillus cereus]PFJ38819.1 hypothetical protein COJ15_17225 [Bacillus thuringiensis]PGP11892.1 hypothetical protein COA01_34290 [Bacillus cereus]